MNSDRRHKSAVTKSLLQFYEYLSKALMYREDGKAIQYLAKKKKKKRKKAKHPLILKTKHLFGNSKCN